MNRADPTRRRPTFGSAYGISREEDGMLPWSWATERLAKARNYWIATTGPDGRPHSTPVWGVWIDESVVWSSSARSRKARNLDRDPRVVVHSESGDETVILEGEVEAATLDDRIADAYQPKYDWRPNVDDTEGERWYRLRPRRAFAWLEMDYPRTATRFDFD